jgi:hypothetical protein
MVLVLVPWVALVLFVVTVARAAFFVLLVAGAALAQTGTPVSAAKFLELIVNAMVDMKPGLLGFDKP